MSTDPVVRHKSQHQDQNRIRLWKVNGTLHRFLSGVFFFLRILRGDGPSWGSGSSTKIWINCCLLCVIMRAKPTLTTNQTATPVSGACSTGDCSKPTWDSQLECYFRICVQFLCGVRVPFLNIRCGQEVTLSCSPAGVCYSLSTSRAL